MDGLNPTVLHLRNSGLTTSTSKVFVEPQFGIMGNAKVFETPDDGIIKQSYLPGMSKAPDKMSTPTKRGNIQPITLSQKPDKVLDPRVLYSSPGQKAEYEKPPNVAVKLAAPSTQTKPIYQITENEINHINKNYSLLDTTESYLVPSEKLQLEDISCTSVQDVFESDPTSLTAQGLNIDNRVEDPLSLALDPASTELFQYLGHEELEVTVGNDAQEINGIQLADDLGLVEYGRQKWDSDVNTYQDNVDLINENFPVLQSVIDVHITTGEEEPVKTFHVGSVCHGTLDALRDLALSHCDLGLQTGLTGIVLKKEYTFFKGGSIQKIGKIGEGSFGSVSLYQHPDSYKKFVIKRILDKTKFRPTEAVVSSMIDDRYLLKCHGLMFENGVPLMIKDFGGEALLKFAQKEKLQDREIWNLTSQLCKGLKALANYDIIHFDIKPENVFIIRDVQGLYLRIGDFGSTKLPADPVDYTTWTAEYMAPEMAKLVLTERVFNRDTVALKERADITTKCDVYPAGLVILFMYTQHHVLMHELVTKGNQNLSSSSRRLNILVQLVADPDLAKKFIPEAIQGPMRGIVCDMLEGDFNKRLSAEQILLKMDGLSHATQTVVCQPVTMATRLRPRTNTQQKVILLGIEDLKPRGPENRPKRRARRSTSAKSGKKMFEKNQNQENEETVDEQQQQPNSAQYNKIMNEPSQVRVRMVKKLLRSKVQDAATTKRPMEHDPTPPAGKRIRLVSSSSCVGSPVSELVNLTEYSLGFGDVEEDGVARGEETEGGQSSFTNIPDLVALKLS